MISKRTAIILIVAIVAILIFETNFSFDKMGKMEANLEHTVAQVTLNIDGEFVDLDGTELTYKYLGGKEALTANFSRVNETGYENLQNNSVGFKPCTMGRNELSFTIPNSLIPTYNSDIIVRFGCEDNESDFNNYSLVINLTTTDEANLMADVVQTLYYPDENGSALSKKAEVSTTLNNENSTIECFTE